MTQDQLSAKLARLGVRIDRPGISKIESGSRHVYDMEVKAIARVLETSVDWLLSGSSEKR